MNREGLAALADVPRQGEGALTLEVDGTPIGIYRVGEEVLAWRNVCPHGAAPVCRGRIDGTRLASDVYDYAYGRDQEILQCPWHGWEFDLRTGNHLAEGSGARLRRYPIEVRDDAIFDASAAATRTDIAAVVSGRDELATGITRFRIARVDGDRFPSWTPGTHIEITTPAGHIRQYSLCGDPRERTSLEFTVLRLDTGRGGSLELHEQVRVGAPLRVTAIRNRFPLLHRPRYLLLAGGIGITPMVPMIDALERRRAQFDVIYVGPSRDRMAFVESLGAHPRVRVIESRLQGRPQLREVLADAPDATTVYACGPAPMLAEIRSLMPPHTGRLELITESFGSRATPGESHASTDQAVTVALARRGLEVVAEPGTSILDAVRGCGVTVNSSCEQGWCGSCETSVVDGAIDHRDSVLSEVEREDGASMMICVSRARSPRLVLDL